MFEELSADGGDGVLEVVGPLWCVVWVPSQCDYCCAGCVVAHVRWGGLSGYLCPTAESLDAHQ